MQLLNKIFVKQFSQILLATLITAPLFAQKVRNETGTVNSRKYSGFSIPIENNQTHVTDFWLVEMEDMGTIRRKRDFYQIEEFNLPGEFHPEAIYYARILENDSTLSRIWMALDPETLLAGESGEENVNKALEEYVSSLPVAYMAYLVRQQIKEAERVIDYTNRQQQKLLQDNKNLELQLKESKAERDKLLETIETLELEILAINQKITDNEKAMERSSEDIERIKKMLDDYQQRLKQLEK